MAYERLDLKHGDVLTESHMTHIEDGIVAVETGIAELEAKVAEGSIGNTDDSNLIDVANPTSAATDNWSYSNGVWTYTAAAYVNLRFDALIPAGETVEFSFDITVESGSATATIRSQDGTTLVSQNISTSGSQLLTYTAEVEDTYRFQIAGINSSSNGSVTNIEVKLRVTETNIGSISDLPTEYSAESASVIEELLDETADLRILLFADNHDYDKNKYLKYQEIMTRGVIDYQIGLGDYVDYSHDEKSIARINLLNSINRAGRKPNQFYAYGNHDVGICGVNAGTDELDIVMSPKENFDVFCRHLKYGSGANFNSANPYGGYFYVDDEPSKIRLIILNTCDIFNHTVVEATGNMTFEEYQATAPYIRYQQQLRVSQEQLDWFSNTALKFEDKNTPADWSVVVFGHHYGVYGSQYLLCEILNAVKNGTSISKTIEVSTRLTMTEEGVYSSTVDSSIVDTYSVNADYTEQGAVTVIGFIYGHEHVDMIATQSGVNVIQVRCDNSEIDDYYIAPFTTDINQGDVFYFYDVNNNIYTFTRTSATSITGHSFVAYNHYLTGAKSASAPVLLLDANGLRIRSVSATFTSSVPENATEITGFARERDGSVAGAESCEILCIDKENRTMTFVPYGTATKRAITY